MTGRLEGSIRRYIGLSTDAKPVGFIGTESDPLPAGSSFLETATGDIYRWNGAIWTAHQDNVTAEWLSLIYLEMRQLREFTELKFNLSA